MKKKLGFFVLKKGFLPAHNFAENDGWILGHWTRVKGVFCANLDPTNTYVTSSSLRGPKGGRMEAPRLAFLVVAFASAFLAKGGNRFGDLFQFLIAFFWKKREGRCWKTFVGFLFAWLKRWAQVKFAVNSIKRSFGATFENFVWHQVMLFQPNQQRALNKLLTGLWCRSFVKKSTEWAYKSVPNVQKCVPTTYSNWGSTLHTTVGGWEIESRCFIKLVGGGGEKFPKLFFPHLLSPPSTQMISRARRHL